ncbi:MAG: hypothetical protein ACTFAK_09755 [Candidatus Electronema sp. VV]
MAVDILIKSPASHEINGRSRRDLKYPGIATGHPQPPWRIKINSSFQEEISWPTNADHLKSLPTRNNALPT